MPSEVKSRVGRVRPSPQRLSIPTLEQVKRWLHAIQLRNPSPKALMCELILRTGIRREECVQWRTWTLPRDRSEWETSGRFVAVTVEYGAKGQKSVDHLGDEKGPRRTVMVPLDLANRLHEYASVTRAKQRARYVNAASSAVQKRARMVANPRTLFLSGSTGLPLSKVALYKCWTYDTSEVFAGWSPHLGRHFWACQQLLDEVKRLRLTDRNPLATNWVYGAVTDAILMSIQPQLGHVDKSTTMIYVAWVCRALGLDTQTADWWESTLEAAAQ